MNKLCNSTHEAFAAFTCSISLTAETKPRRNEATMGFFKNAYRNFRKCYFDRRTFCFETNILRNRRSVQWRTIKFKVRKTALQNKLTLNSYSSNGKETAERLLISSNFTLFQSCLKPILEFFKMLHVSRDHTTNNQKVKRSLNRLQNVNSLPKDYIRTCLTCRSLAELVIFIDLVERQEYIYSNL